MAVYGDVLRYEPMSPLGLWPLRHHLGMVEAVIVLMRLMEKAEAIGPLCSIALQGRPGLLSRFCGKRRRLLEPTLSCPRAQPRGNLSPPSAQARVGGINTFSPVSTLKWGT